MLEVEVAAGVEGLADSGGEAIGAFVGQEGVAVGVLELAIGGGDALALKR